MGDRSMTRAAQAPCHVVHRRADGSPCFPGDEDYLVYLDCLKEEAEHHGCVVHAYALMPAEVQLLASLDSETRLARWLRCASDRYVEYVNYTHQRDGEFWAEGPQVTAIDEGKDVLARYLAIEVAPVKAGLVARPANYRWSSHRHHACGSEDPIIQEHQSYLELGTTQLARQLAYHELLRRAFPGQEPVGTERSTDRYPALEDGWREDGIKRSVRGLRWQAMNARGRSAPRPPAPGGEAPARDYASDIAQARAAAAHRLASK